MKIINRLFGKNPTKLEHCLIHKLGVPIASPKEHFFCLFTCRVIVSVEMRQRSYQTGFSGDSSVVLEVIQNLANKKKEKPKNYSLIAWSIIKFSCFWKKIYIYTRITCSILPALAENSCSCHPWLPISRGKRIE